MQKPGLLRRFGSLLYDSLTFIALWMLGAAIFTSIYGSVTGDGPRHLLQAFCATVIASYFLWCWTHGGQTLGMKAWRLKVVYANGAPLTLLGASLRLVLAIAGMLAGGVSLWWAFVDQDRRFLHDRLAKTSIEFI